MPYVYGSGPSGQQHQPQLPGIPMCNLHHPSFLTLPNNASTSAQAQVTANLSLTSNVKRMGMAYSLHMPPPQKKTCFLSVIMLSLNRQRRPTLVHVN